MDNSEHWIENMDNAGQVIFSCGKNGISIFITLKTRLSCLHTMEALCFWLAAKMENSKKWNGMNNFHLKGPHILHIFQLCNTPRLFKNEPKRELIAVQMHKYGDSVKYPF